MIDIFSAALASQLALRKSHVSPGSTDGLLGRFGNGYPAVFSFWWTRTNRAASAKLAARFQRRAWARLRGCSVAKK